MRVLVPRAPRTRGGQILSFPKPEVQEFPPSKGSCCVQILNRSGHAQDHAGPTVAMLVGAAQVNKLKGAGVCISPPPSCGWENPCWFRLPARDPISCLWAKELISAHWAGQEQALGL